MGNDAVDIEGSIGILFPEHAYLAAGDFGFFCRAAFSRPARELLLKGGCSGRREVHTCCYDD